MGQERSGYFELCVYGTQEAQIDKRLEEDVCGIVFGSVSVHAGGNSDLLRQPVDMFRTVFGGWLRIIHTCRY